MINLRLEISASKAMELVNQLRTAGCVQGVDFDFRYYPSIQYGAAGIHPYLDN